MDRTELAAMPPRVRATKSPQSGNKDVVPHTRLSHVDYLDSSQRQHFQEQSVECCSTGRRIVGRHHGPGARRLVESAGNAVLSARGGY